MRHPGRAGAGLYARGATALVGRSAVPANSDKAATGAPGCLGKRVKQLGGPHAELSCHDWLVRRDHQRVGLKTHKATGANGRRYPLGDEQVPGRRSAS